MCFISKAALKLILAALICNADFASQRAVEIRGWTVQRSTALRVHPMVFLEFLYKYLKFNISHSLSGEHC